MLKKKIVLVTGCPRTVQLTGGGRNATPAGSGERNPSEPEGQALLPSVRGAQEGFDSNETARRWTDSVGSSLPGWIGGVRAFESLDSRNGAFTEGGWVRPTNGVLQIAFKSASRGCQNLREVKSQTLGDPQRGGGHRQESGTGEASKRVKNECFHFLSPLEVQFRLKSRGKLKCVYFGAFPRLLQN